MIQTNIYKNQNLRLQSSFIYMADLQLLQYCSKSLAILLALCLMAVFSGEAKVHSLTWAISYNYNYLDCYKKLAIGINRQTPWPILSAALGDTIIINVINNLVMENVAIQWHII